MLIIINTLLLFFFGILALVLFVLFPLLVLLFLALSMAIWYRFGVEIYRVDRETHLVNALFSVLVGVTPLLFLTLLYQTLPMAGSASSYLAVYLSLLMSMVATILMPVMVVIGALTHFMRDENCL